MNPQAILKKIEEIINRNFQVHPQGNRFLLEEPKTSGYPSTLLKKNGSILIYQFDIENSNDSVFPIFDAKVPHVSTIADYIIFYPFKDEKLFVFICNLKSNNTTGASAQAQAGWHISEYIMRTVERLFSYPKNINIEYRSLIFTTRPPTKRFSTNIKKEDYSELGGSGLKSILLKAGVDCSLDIYCI